MRLPIKINAPIWANAWLPEGFNADPRIITDPDVLPADFEKAISRVKIDSTWKTTATARHPLTDALIVEHCAPGPDTRILEVGASCGTTSIDLISRLGQAFARFYVTDRFARLPYRRDGQTVWFYHPLDGRCIMAAGRWLIGYEDSAGALRPLAAWSRALLRDGGRASPDDPLADLMLPALRTRQRSDARIVIREHDCLSAWTDEPVDIIKVANVLNRVYFSDPLILGSIQHLVQALRPRGSLLVTDNTERESVSWFQLADDGRLMLRRSIQGGAAIEGLIAAAALAGRALREPADLSA